MYDPIYVINNNLYDERSEMVQYYNREQPEERKYILVKEDADHISSDVLTKRMMFFSKTVDNLQSEDVLKTILEMLPKKKNGTLFLKRSVVIAPVMITNKSLDFYVLCAKAVKDAEVEIGLKYYSFGRIEDVLELLKTVDEIFESIQKR